MRPSLAATGPSTSDYFSSNPHNMKIIQLEDRTIHIVRSHEEVEHLKRTKSGGFDWHLHGSPEHVESLKQAHDFHTRRASELRKKHPDTYDEVHRIRDDLDALSRELEKLTSKPVELEANFGKFGYSAHIRTHDADDGPETPNEKVKIDDDGIGKKGAETNTLASASSRKKKSTTMKLYKKPVLRQYFHQGLLYRAKDSEEVASFELFVDLLYVGIIAVNGDKATEDPTGNGFLRFCVTFIPSWKIWSDVGTLISQFATDDILQRIGILFILACLVGYTTNIVSAFETTYSQLIAFYLAARLFVGLSQFLMGCVLPHVRPVMTLNAATVLIPVAFWIGSVHLEEPKKEILIWLAIVWDLFGNVISIFLIRGSMVISKEFNQKMLRVFAYYPAVNIEHKTERTGAFVTLVFGYSIVSVIYQNQARFGLNTFFGKAILSLIQAFCFNWMYFDIDGSYHHLHAIRRHAISSTVWLTAHLPFIMAFTLSGAALSRLVVAHDCPNASVEDLTEMYRARSEEEIPEGLRWFYCCGLGVAFICMAIISASHVHTPIESQRLRKRYRLAFRIAIGIVWLTLPLAKHLNSLELIGTTCSMTVLALAVDIWGTSCVYERFLGSDTPCQYETKMAGASRSSVTLQGEVQKEKEGGICNYLCKV